MKLFIRGERRTKIIINLLILLWSAVGMVRQKEQVHNVDYFQRLFRDAVGPLQKSLFFLRSRLVRFADHYIFIVTAAKENEALKGKIQEMENTIFQLSELRRENARLKKLLKFGQDMANEKVLAQVIAKDASSEFRVIRINKGQKDGIQLKSAVVTADGLVGHVFRMSSHTSDILTILDPNARVDGIIAKTRAHGIVEGGEDQSGHLQMKYIPRTGEVGPGDAVVSSGLGRIFPKGIQIGKVVFVKEAQFGMTKNVKVSPSVNFNRLEEVIIISALGRSEELPENE